MVVVVAVVVVMRLAVRLEVDGNGIGDCDVGSRW